MSYFNSILIIGGWIVLVFCTSIYCNNQWPRQKELGRKIIHIGTGPVIPLAWWLDIPKTQAVSVAIIITLVLIINHQWNLLPNVEDIKRNSYGTVAYGISITLLLFIFWPENALAVCSGVLVMAFGDGLAGLLGRNIKSPTWLIFSQKKSFAGTITMGLVSFITLIILNSLLVNSISLLPIIGITFLAVFLEQFSLWGIDNLLVPIGVALACYYMINNI